MFFFTNPVLQANMILIAAAVIPAIVLMIKVYRADRLEKESPKMLRRLAVAGILSTFLALVEEKLLSTVLDWFLTPDTVLYQLILYFGIVGVAEESSKYLFMRLRTWKSPEFNCQFDGVVYAVFVSLGFALWENIGYVFQYGIYTAVVRAVTAVPGHACFGVFMGVFYGVAKRCDASGNKSGSSFYRFCALLFPIVIHGAYDFIATISSATGTYIFIAFVAVMFLVSYLMVGKMAKSDRYITSNRFHRR